MVVAVDGESVFPLVFDGGTLAEVIDQLVIPGVVNNVSRRGKAGLQFWKFRIGGGVDSITSIVIAASSASDRNRLNGRTSLTCDPGVGAMHSMTQPCRSMNMRTTKIV